VGIESTVLDLCDQRPRILRPGGISREQTEAVIGPVDMPSGMVASATTSTKSPGQHAIHYAPTTPAYRFEPSQRQQLDLRGAAILNIDAEPQTYARQLYSRLREMDAGAFRAIYVEMPPDTPEWAAVRDRLLRATRPLSDDR
jgi:L-threonylcarbamoyladenylate synthase